MSFTLIQWTFKLIYFELQNAKIESSLEEAKQHICQLQREAKDTGSLKSVFQHSRSDVKGSSDEDKGVIDRVKTIFNQFSQIFHKFSLFL